MLLFSETPNDERMTQLAEAGRKAGGIVIGFEPGPPPDGKPGPFIAACEYGIYTYGVSGVVDVKGADKPVAPTTGALNIAMLWVWTSQLAGVMAERGNPISMWKTLHYKDAAEVNAPQQELFTKRGY